MRARLIRAVALWAVMAGSVWSAPYPFLDDFESGAAAWITNGTWNLTTLRSVSPPTSATDSPGAFYTNHTDAALALASGMDFSEAVRPALSFQLRHVLENGYDFLYVESSTNGGAGWAALPGGAFTGTREAWTRFQFDLDDHAGAADVRFRFRLVTDGSVVQDGVYLDDVTVGERPQPALLTATSTSPVAVTLAWTEASEASFAAYHIHRALASNTPPIEATRIASLNDPGATNWTDIAVSPKTRYHYRVVTELTNRLTSASNEASARTLDGMEAPFLDNGEGGVATWIADPPWGLAPEAAFGGAAGWSDSPATNYGDNVNAALTLADPVSLAGWTRPTLMIVHRYQFLSGDFGYLELSTNAGNAWTSIASYTAGSSGWTRVRFDLAAFTNAASLLLRFRVTSDASGNADGWRIDDISLSDAPAMVPAPDAANLQPTSIDLTWTASEHPALAHYVIARSVSNNPTLNTLPRLTSTTNAYTDTGLMVDSNYHYRIYAVDRWGGYSADSPTATLARTTLPILPLTQDFESGSDLWALNGGWTLASNDAYAGAACLANGAETYSNSVNDTAVLRVNLTGADRPVLRFTDRHRLAAGDYGYVEISAPGRSAFRRHGVSGSRTNWQEQVIDLSYYKGNANVQILFRLATDGTGVDDGWRIDNLSVTDEGSPLLALPFVEDFETGLGHWVETSAWQQVAGGAYQGDAQAADNLERITPDTYYYLNLDHDLDLTAMASPQCSAWVRGFLGPYSLLGLEVSADGGANWATRWSRSTETGGFSNEWQRVQIDLTPYKSSTARLRWVFHAYYGYHADANAFLDKFTIADAPPGVGVLPPVPALKSAQIHWNPAALGDAFQAYRILRSPDTNPNNGNDTIVGVVTNQADTSFTDTGLAIGATYYYWVYVSDTNDLWTLSTNYVPVTTVPVALPFTDAFDDLSQWDVTGSWGIDTNEGVLADSPDGDYGNNLNITAKTAVNLTGADRPVLRFTDRHRLAVNDYGYVEISAPGRSAIRCYGVYGARTNNQEQVIDLSYYKGNANVQILFRLATDGTGVDDGWRIDNLAVTDEGSPLLALPFVEDFETGLGHWVETSAWQQVTDGAYQGDAQAADSLERITPDTYYYLNLAHDLDLTAMASPQCSAWVRGFLGAYSLLGLEVSADGGANWANRWSRSTETGGFSNEWQRVQIDLTPYKSTNARLRWVFHAYYGYHADANAFIDKLTIAEAPSGIGVLPPVPALKSAQINWNPAALGDAFQAYRILRSPDANPNNGNDTIVGVVTNQADTSFTDTGLAIGATYYYWVYVSDTNDLWTLSTNYVPVTTVPVALPFTDAFDDLSQWDVTGSWGIDTNEGVLADSPDGDYGNNLNITAKTAVNLTGAVRPVLRFTDRHRLAAGDYGYVEISAPGRSAIRCYGVYGARTNNQEQVIDLSYYKGNANVQILFRLATDGTGVDDGWRIDNLSVTDEGSPLLALPFVEDFENGLGHWVETSAWQQVTDGAYQGDAQAADSLERITPDTYFYLNLAHDLDLTAMASPQCSAWVRGFLGPYSLLGLEVSADGGANWATRWSRSTETGGFSNEWQRVQIDLTPYKSSTARLRWVFHAYYGYHADANAFLDKFTIAEAPSGIGVLPPVHALKSAQIHWNPAAIGDAFQAYRVLRSPDTNPNNGNDTIVGIVTNQADTSFTDTGLAIGATYYYWVYVSDTNDLWTLSTNYVPVTTVPVALPFTDAFDDLSQWDVTGSWGIDTNEGVLADSPVGNYPNNQTTYAQSAVNLTGSEWPILRFTDRYRFVANDYGFVEVSPNGSAWTRVYGVTGAQEDWHTWEIDLSQWKDQPNLRIRFILYADGSGNDDGWFIDDVSVTDRGAAVLPVPFFDGFEAGRTNWLEDVWALSTNQPASGSNHLITAITHLRPEVQIRLPLGGSMDLSLTTNASITFRLRGYLQNYSVLYFQVSANGGLTWANLLGISSESGWNTNAWTAYTYPLNAYRTANVRFRFLAYSYWGTDAPVKIEIDQFSIGETAPGAPSLFSPADFANTESIRPTLVVNNAFDPNFDPLTYRFEVYGDAGLSNLLAQVPAVASGIERTSWQVDVNLENSRQYWWRCQASDGSNVSPWMAVATFFINETNTPPAVVIVAGPPKGATLRTASGILSWYPTTDADAGDTIRAYHIQIDPDPAFAAPLVDDPTLVVENAPTGTYWTVSRALFDMSGHGNLGAVSNYFWRIRAQDSRFKWSDWSAPGQWFIYGVPPPNPYELVRNPNGSLTLRWEVGTENFYVYQSPSLLTQAWQVIAGPLDLNEYTLPAGTNGPAGFYRVGGE